MKREKQKVKIKMNKYYALIFLCAIVYFGIFLIIIVMSFTYALYIYIIDDIFLYKKKYIFLALKISLSGILPTIIIWYLECRRLGVKIFGK